MKDTAKPNQQRPYTYNDNFARKIREELDKLLEAEFIYEIEHTEWVSPIVVVPKKNGKLRVCVNLKKVKEYGLHYDETALGAVNQIIK